jgi:putative copper export protein/methionine-rich copper-binding protein CopC
LSGVSRGARRTLIGVVMMVAIVATPGSAAAHLALRSSTPAEGARLETPPDQLRLLFTQRVELAFSEITLLGPGGAQLTISAPRAHVDSANVLLVDLVRRLAPGGYTVVWRVAGADGHPVRGRFSFTVLEPPPAQEAATGESGAADPRDPAGEPAAVVTPPGQEPMPGHHHAPPDEQGADAGSPLFVVVRWLTFIGVLGLIGIAGLRMLVLRRLRMTATVGATFADEVEVRAVSLGRWLVAIVLVTALARLYLQSAAIHGSDRALEPALLGAMVSRTLWGWGWILQLLAGLAALVATLPRRGAAWGAASVAALALAVTPALSGHAAGMGRGAPLAITIDWLHVLGAGGWMGTLLALLVAGIPAALRDGSSSSARSVASIVRAFSPVALACAGLVVLSGLATAWLHMAAVSELWTSAYGRTLLLKVAIVALVAAAGAYNWRRLTPALEHESGVGRLRRTATMELVAGASVLLVTAVLVAVQPEHHPAPATTPSASSASGSPSR